MEQKTHPKSNKPIKSLDGLLGENGYIFPVSMANERDIVTGLPAIFVQSGGRKWFIPCGVETKIDYVAYCVLKDSGMSPEKYEVNGEADPLYDQR